MADKKYRGLFYTNFIGSTAFTATHLCMELGVARE
jgi:hypothetical protein